MLVDYFMSDQTLRRQCRCRWHLLASRYLSGSRRTGTARGVIAVLTTGAAAPGRAAVNLHTKTKGRDTPGSTTMTDRLHIDFILWCRRRCGGQAVGWLCICHVSMCLFPWISTRNRRVDKTLLKINCCGIHARPHGQVQSRLSANMPLTAIQMLQVPVHFLMDPSTCPTSSSK